MSNRARTVSSPDKFPNVIYDSCTQSAANTLTFEEINVGLNIFDKVGLIIHRVEYYKMDNLLLDDTDTIVFGLSQSDSWTTAGPEETSVIDHNRRRVVEIGAATAAYMIQSPFVKEFTGLPGGGILTTPKPLYLYVDSTNLGSEATVDIRMFFTIIKLKPEEYFELLESRQYFG